MIDDQFRSQIERLATMPASLREREAGETAVPEPILLDLIDEVRDLVLSDLDRALALGDVLRLIADRLALPTARARARSAWAHALNYANRFEEAIASLEEAGEIARASGDDLEVARADLAKVQSLARLGRFEEAIRAAVRAAEAFEAANERSLAARAVANHAVLLRMVGRWSESVDAFDRALVLGGGDPTIAASIQSNRAESLLELGRFELAEAAFRQSCELLESAGMERVAAIVRGNLADLLGRQGRLSESIDQFERARRYFERDRAAGDLARLEAELADVLAAVGLLDDARRLYEHSCAALESCGLAAERARALTGLGALLITRDPALARPVLEQAEEAFKELGSDAGQARVRLLYARHALACGDPEAARRLIDVGVDEPPIDEIARQTILADIALATSDLGSAAEAVYGALEAATAMALPSVLADLYHRLGRIRAAQGRRADALEALRRAMHEVERIRGALQGDRFRAAFLGDHADIFRDASDAILESGTARSHLEAFDVGERARARALLDLIHGGVELAEYAAASSATSPGEARLLEQLAAARARLNFLYSRLDPSAEAGPHRPFSEWLTDVRVAESSVASIESRLASTRTGRSMLGAPVPAEELAASLPTGRAVLVYTRHRKSLGCFVVRRESVEFTDLHAPLERVDELAADFGFQLRRAVTRGIGVSARAQRRQEAAVRASQALYDAVLRPIGPKLDGLNAIAVVPHAELHLVPFAALHDGDRFLTERLAVTRLPSASLYQTVATLEPDCPDAALVVGVADRFAPEINDEVESIARTLRDARLLCDDGATGDRVLSEITNAGIIHIASHGMFPPGNPMAAALRLADRWVTVRELFSINLRGAVVTLSGCDTGRLEIDSGEEGYGFVRGFLAARAGGIVSSLWASHDRVARELMTSMYELAPAGGTPAARVFAGLRSAQQRAIDGGVHPGLWSGFMAVGAS